ncbi:MAG: mechanosensitive ion channel [Agathobacter sp.]|uniref:mechanosensitive ion channel family protein n=1 Tax=Agathobacter sp. TaxID=2021311 RepID=UPI002E779880|nr:mechanosensitive ion channel domain-containing protein [Agathobacter sp.]MEE1216704.1 mechanosensitive ion channel [Agathobacter sp.]
MKKILKLVISIVILIVLTGIAFWTNVFNDFQEVSYMLNIDYTDIIKVLIMIAFVVSIKWVIQIILENLKPKTNRGNTAKTLINSALQYIAVIIMLCWGFVLIGVNVGTVLASVGIVALIIGFGAESLIEDVITGIFMLFENQYNVGDIIEVDNFRGKVTTIGIRTTVIEDTGGNKKIVNNAAMKNILNRSKISSKAVSDIGISYDDDLEKLERVLPEILKKIGEESSIMEMPQYLGVQELQSSALVLRFVAEVDEINIFAAQRELNRKLYLEFKKLGYVIPYDQLDVHTV